MVWLLATLDPVIDDAQFACAMALLGVGMGMLASQLGNVVQSSVDEEQRSEAGGMQFTAQNLGSALGTALMGSILVGALAHAFTSQIADDPRLSEETRERTGVALEAGISFVPTDQVRSAAERAAVARKTPGGRSAGRSGARTREADDGEISAERHGPGCRPRIPRGAVGGGRGVAFGIVVANQVVAGGLPQHERPAPERAETGDVHGASHGSLWTSSKTTEPR